MTSWRIPTRMDVIPCYLTEEEEKANIQHTTELLEKTTGKRPRGWISPRSTPSLRSPRLLAEAGYEWHGDTLNDDLPYLVKFPKHSIVAFPNNTEVNDLPLYMRYGNSPRVYVEIFEDWLEIRAQAGNRASAHGPRYPHARVRPPAGSVDVRTRDGDRKIRRRHLDRHALGSGHTRPQVLSRLTPMDLGIRGRKAIVCASSRGLGRACAFALVREGCGVVINGRDKARLDRTAAEIAQAIGAEVTAVVADLDTEAGRAALIAACPDADILVNNNGGPPPGKLDEWGHAEWLAAIEANMLAPIFMIKALINGMRQRKFGRIVNITSARVKTPTAAMGLSASARSGLTAFCKGLSIEVAADNVTINNLLPERIDTDRQSFMAKRAAQASGETSFEKSRHRIADSLPAKRYGTAEEFAEACAFLCSAQAGFISGQNLQLDGGNYRGLI